MGFLTNFYGFKGYLALARQKKDDAEKYLSKAWDQGLEKTSYLTAYGSLLMQKGEYAKCKEVYEKAFEGLGVNVAYYTAIRCSIITCKYKLGDVEEALVEAKEMYEEMKSGTSFVLYGYLLMDQNRIDEALTVNLEGYEYDPMDVAICDNLGQTYYRMGDMENAKKYFEEAIDIKRDMIDSCYFLALIVLGEGDIKRAYYLLDDAMDSTFSALTTVTRDELEKKYKEVEALYEKSKGNNIEEE